MKRASGVALGLALILLLPAACRGRQSPQPPPPVRAGQVPAKELRAALDAMVAKYGIRGVAVRVWAPSWGWGSAMGVADLKTNKRLFDQDIFPIRSVTKSMTTTRILQLAAGGRVSLDDPISKYVDGVPNGDEITLDMLGRMTSGLADYSKNSAFQQELIKDLSQPWTDDELLSFALDQKPAFAPGTAFQYSNTNTVLLGKVVEKVTGQSFAADLKTQLFEPLGLDHTSYPADGVVPTPNATGYQLDPETGELTPLDMNLTALGPSGGAATTVGDLGTWGTALADGSLVTPEMQTARETDPMTPGPKDPEYDGYAFGIGEIDGWWGHTGEGLGYEALVMSDPETGRTVAILMNLTGPPGHMSTDLFRQYVQILDAA